MARRPAGPAAEDASQTEEPPLQRQGQAAVQALGPNLFLSPEQVVRRALQLACAQPEDLVCVAGPDGLQAMVSLCRAGFERVECARQATCAGADERCDALLIVGPAGPDELAETVRRTARLVRDDGALVVQSTGRASEAAVARALRDAGLEPSFTLVDRGCGRMVMHRVRRPAARLDGKAVA
jgi:hypothetical protein